jgi:pyruvate/2-oxoglutarate/acetoin dehydrogenase E1 component/TPP-dependent pyruvate/acetoin dehydrogenase alpha subunit
MPTAPTAQAPALPLSLTKADLLADFRLACESRQASLTGRKEVFAGKAKFGIFGDGKEVAQLAMARAFQPGDWRAGYYRDQTFMLAIGELTLEAWFAQLYAHADVEAEPASGGRSMNGHFATRLLDEDGNWLPQTTRKNSSADISPTGGQMPRLLGLAFASKLYRQNPALHDRTDFSVNGNEVAFGTIGNASTSEGMFFEALNAAGVLQVPMLMSVWDDAFGISVGAEHHTTKQSISAALAGLQRDGEGKSGFEIFVVKGWDYAALLETYDRAARLCREQHVPVLVHVVEMTQPQGHSTSGSHERYKTKERLAWEEEFDPIKQFRSWLLSLEICSEAELDTIDAEAKERVRVARAAAWNGLSNPIKAERQEVAALVTALAQDADYAAQRPVLDGIVTAFGKLAEPSRAEHVKLVRKALRVVRGMRPSAIRRELAQWLESQQGDAAERYNSTLFSQSEHAATLKEAIAPEYAEDAPVLDGREILNACFDAHLNRDATIFAFGEDVGRIGDVNQGFAGLQDKYGVLRVADTGIRECTIAGQGIGAALRGLRPIAEIQYLDYIHYALQILSDDLACLQWRTKGGQKAPLIIRTRGHRLEGIWHSGSPIGMILNAVRCIHVLVPRNMTQAAGFYNVLLRSDEPAIVIECLNGYRLKEKLPTNIIDFQVPLGEPEVLRAGTDVTIVTYGSMCRIVLEAAAELAEVGIEAEVIDVQSLLPFDTQHSIVESIKKTNRVIFADEDVPGGASAFMMQQVVDEQQAYRWLDSAPRCLSAHAHRPPYGSDGDYFSKPNPEDVFDLAYELLREADPKRFPAIY